MDFTKLKLKEAKIQDFSVRFEYWILDGNGRNTLNKHIMSIGPAQDISDLEFPEYESALIQTARIGYVKPE